MPACDAQRDGRQRALQAVLDRLVEHRADEPLARGADQHRQPEVRPQLAQPAEDRDADRRRLGEPEARIDDQAGARDAGRRSDPDALGESAGQPLDQVVGSLGRASRPARSDGPAGRVGGWLGGRLASAPVPDDQGGAGLSRDLGQARIERQAADVVDDRRAGRQRRLGDAGLAGVDRDRHRDRPASRSSTGRTRASSTSSGIRSWPGRVLSPPTSRMSAPAATSASARRRAASGPPWQAVAGERVGRDVQNPHDQRPDARSEVWEPLAEGAGKRHESSLRRAYRSVDLGRQPPRPVRIFMRLSTTIQMSFTERSGQNGTVVSAMMLSSGGA